MTRYALTQDFEKLLGVVIPERGQNAMLRCPFHDDSRASLSVNLETGLWICFGCSERGTIFMMAGKLEREFGELESEEILSRSGLADQDPREPKDFRDRAKELHLNLWKDRPQAVLRYLESRGLSSNILTKFVLGWDGNRIAMPYYDGDSVVAIKYRYPDGFKSYEPGSIHYIYNVNEARAVSDGVVIVCEGESDTHAVWSAVDKLATGWHNIAVVGVPGVGAGLPSRKTWELWALELLFAKKVYIAFDADSAGDAGSELAMSIMGDKTRRMRPTYGNDMAEHLMKGGTLGEAGMDAEDLRVQGT